MISDLLDVNNAKILLVSHDVAVALINAGVRQHFDPEIVLEEYITQ